MISWIKSKIKFSKYFKYIDKFLNYHFEKKRFYLYNNYKLDLKNPKTFNQKVVVKKIFDRNINLSKTADKYLVKSIVKNIEGLNLIPTIFYGRNPNDINFKDLPQKYIIKGTHYSGRNLIIKNHESVDFNDVINHCNYLISTGIHFHSNEWLYRNIVPSIIIEPLLLDENGEIPNDYKFFVFNGNVRLIQVDRERFKKIKRCLYDPEGKIIKGSILYPSTELRIDLDKEQLDFAIGIAEKCALDFDFVRVDLYIIKDKVYFGELTHYPGSGKSKIEPVELDCLLGSYWKLGDYFRYD